MARSDGVQGGDRNKEERVNPQTGKKEVKYEGDDVWVVIEEKVDS